MRNLMFSALLAATALLSPAVQAEGIEAGKQYVELSTPVPVAKPGKIEVVELFWYGCPHCYQFESTLNPWADKLPEDARLDAFAKGGDDLVLTRVAGSLSAGSLTFVAAWFTSALYFGGWSLPGVAFTGVWGALASVAVFFAKTIAFIFLFLWVRWTFPRFRYDQLMDLGWKFLLPLSFFHLIAVAAFVAAK